MKNTTNLASILLAGTLIIGCTGNKQESANTADLPAINRESISIYDQSGLERIAEKIVYDVEIISPYPDDPWMTECLKGLKHEELVNFVFEGIYNETFSAFDIFEGSPLSSQDIGKMEEEGQFSREQIGKFQFMEEWFLDTLNMSFHKEVREIRMGMQKFNENGDLTGYDPLFRVIL